ncbi:hypothetical protein F5Y12DRAFT_743146 [Xylaria sp. FL1777]|nr:hypothetical protein F5Y12DRAFT_743146 [Xylaria sp. FL1777]
MTEHSGECSLHSLLWFVHREFILWYIDASSILCICFGNINVNYLSGSELFIFVYLFLGNFGSLAVFDRATTSLAIRADQPTGIVSHN